MKDTNYMIILLDVGEGQKHMTEFSMFRWLKTLTKIFIEGTHLRTAKAIYKEPMDSQQWNAENLSP